jgi:hypothetical protein
LLTTWKAAAATSGGTAERAAGAELCRARGNWVETGGRCRCR